MFEALRRAFIPSMTIFNLREITIPFCGHGTYVSEYESKYIEKHYYYGEDYVGHIIYNTVDNNIGMFWLSPKYRKIGLGKQILKRAINNLHNENPGDIWLSASKGHEFWENVWGGKFKYKENIHPSISTGGYYLTKE